MKKQETTHHSTSGHGDPGHNAGHQHDFKDIEQWLSRLDNPEREKTQLPNEVIAKLALQPNEVVVDVGAGTGYFALRIAEAYPQVRVIAADAEAEMVGYLKSQATKRKLANLEPILLDAANPNLPVRANLALMVNAFHHIDNRVSYLKLLSKSMASGARIAVIDYSTESPEGPPAAHRIARAEVIEELKQADYELEQDLKFLPHQYFLIFKQE
jgi:ubiquinone/menaquinone biosynthesis C-methylase UbiE